jgi:hypothetical protein
MLSWPPGRRETDGVWARHWYGEVERSTTFRPWVEKSQSLPAGLEELCQACLGFHERLARHRLA